MAETRTTCPYCGVGCGVVVTHDGGRITGVRGDPEHPANFGQLCTKGTTLYLTTQPGPMSARLAHPLVRDARGGEPRRAAWDDALDLVADRFAACIREHGPDAVGFYISGQLLTEDYSAFNKLARALVGTNNIDSNSRLCMSSAASKETRRPSISGCKSRSSSDRVSPRAAPLEQSRPRLAGCAASPSTVAPPLPSGVTTMPQPTPQ